MATLNITLTGLSPLLMRNPSALTVSKGDTIGIHHNPTPEADAAASRYILPDHTLYVPAIALRNCILNGSKGYKIGKRGAMAILAGAILMIDEAFPLYRNNKPIKENDYTIYTCRAVVQHQGIPRSRARIDLPWELRCSFGFNDYLFENVQKGIEFIKTVANNAGQVVGLLDYRVEKKGWFGRFLVKEISSEN